MIHALLLAAALSPPLHAPAETPETPEPAPRADRFGEVWYDGRAELNGYRWTGTRYGELRTGEAVAIFVTEPFDERQRVKSDRAEGEHVTTALKLNLVRDFQTGVYDYNTMSSVFVRADDLTPMKLSFSSAEWCGHAYEELEVRERRTRVDVRSYFQGESGVSELARHTDGLIGDQLLVWLRGLRGAPLDAGESVERPFLAGALERRLRHTPAEWGSIRITRDLEPRGVEVPAGAFEVLTYRASTSDGRRLIVDVASESPHALVRWSWSRDGTVLDAGEWTGTERLPYWQRHREGDEALRESLGL